MLAEEALLDVGFAAVLCDWAVAEVAVARAMPAMTARSRLLDLIGCWLIGLVTELVER